MTVCNRCGKENQDHYKFCLGCGAELTAAPKSDVGMMRTMMADPGQSPLAGAPLRGAPMGPPPGGPPRPSGGMPGMPPAGPLGGPAMPPPMGPPPGVPYAPPGYGAPAGGPPPGYGAPAGPPPGPSAGAASGMRRCPSCASDVPPTFRFCGTCGFRMDEVSAPNVVPTAPTAPPVAPAAARLSMTLIRPDGTEGGTHQLHPGENQLGRSFGPVFENDGYLSPIHAMLDIRGVTGTVRDLDSLNGVFVKMTAEEELDPGQIIRIGQELLRFELIGVPEPTPDGTELMGSPNPGFWGKLTVIIGREVTGAAFPLLGDSVTLGRERGEINFPDDGYVSGLHARITLRDGRVYLQDLGSSNGSFMKVNGERAIGHDSYVLLGQQLFRLNFA